MHQPDGAPPVPPEDRHLGSDGPDSPIGIGAIHNSDAGRPMFTMAITLTVLCVLLGGVVVWSHLK